MISELRTELQQLDEAVLVLQRLTTSGAKRKGRPPEWMTQVPRQTCIRCSSQNVKTLQFRSAEEDG